MLSSTLYFHIVTTLHFRHLSLNDDNVSRALMHLFSLGCDRHVTLEEYIDYLFSSSRILKANENGQKKTKKKPYVNWFDFSLTRTHFRRAHGLS